MQNTITQRSLRASYIKFKITGDVLEIQNDFGGCYEVINMSDPQNPTVIGGNVEFNQKTKQEAYAFFNSLQTA